MLAEIMAPRWLRLLSKVVTKVDVPKYEQTEYA